MSTSWTETGTATWIPSGGRWLYSWVHAPRSGESRGAVVVVNSVAREQVIAFRALRVLAIELARAGFTVIRPDLTGVGEASLLEGHLDLSETWVSDIDACADFARLELGAQTVHGVGLRIGAALLARCTSVDGTRLYWEPIAGKRWLRRQSVLRRVAVDIPSIESDGGAEVPGALYNAAQAESLRALASPCGGSPTEIVYMEPDPGDAMRLHSTVTLFARVPLDSVRHLVRLVPGHDPRPLPQWQPRHVVEMVDPTDGSVCRETITEVGPNRLPAVISSPPAEWLTAPQARSVVFASGSAEPKDGPTALWVQISRRAAARGHICLRVERRGSGDLGDPAADRDPSPYLPTAVVDFADAGRFMADRFGLPVVGIGFCSGSWVIMRAACHGSYDEVIGIAQGAWRRGARYYERMEAETLVRMSEAPVPTIEQESTKEPIDPGDDRPIVRLKGWLRKHLPYAIWRELGRLDKATCPEHLLRETAAHAQVTLLFGDTDRAQFLLERGDESLARLKEEGIDVETEDLGPLDHALLAHQGRLTVIDHVTARLDGHPRQRSSRALRGTQRCRPSAR